MDKLVAHYSLVDAQAAVAKRGVACFTKTALDNGFAMGLTTNEMLQVIASLTLKNIYKSMTTYADSRIWQDVYRAQTTVGMAYIKLSDPNGQRVVIQFKDL